MIEELDTRAKKKEETESCYFSAEGYDTPSPPSLHDFRKIHDGFYLFSDLTYYYSENIHLF